MNISNYRLINIFIDIANSGGIDDNELESCVKMSSLLICAHNNGHKRMIIFLIKEYPNKIEEESGSVPEILFDLFSPVEILEIITHIYRYRRNHYQFYISVMHNIPKQLIYHYNENSIWRIFTTLYISRISRLWKYRNKYEYGDLLFLLLLFKKNKKRDYIMNILANCNDMIFNRFYSNLMRWDYRSLSEIGLNKIKLTELINKNISIGIDRDNEYYNFDNSRSIIFYKVALSIIDKDFLLRYRGIYNYTTKMIYIKLKKMKLKLENKKYVEFMNNIVDELGNVNLELFYHQHRRDKLDLNRILMLPARLLYKAITIILSAFISKNLTRLSGYYV